MGGLGKKMRITYITFFIACLAIAGIPPFAGFFSKDEILSAAFANNPILYVIGLGGALLTAFYMFRLLTLTFAGKFRGTDDQWHHVHESPGAITFPLITLAVLSTIGGFVGIPELFAKNGHKLGEFLAPVFESSTKILTAHHIPEQTEIILLAVSVILIAGVCFWAWNKYKKYSAGETAPSGFAKAIKNKFYIDELYDAIIVKPLKAISNVLGNVVDKSGIDGIVNGVGKSINYGSRQIRLLQSGQVGTLYIPNGIGYAVVIYYSNVYKIILMLGTYYTFPELLLWIPLVTGVIAFFIRKESSVKAFALISSLLTLAVSIISLCYTDVKAHPEYFNYNNVRLCVASLFGLIFLCWARWYGTLTYVSYCIYITAYFYCHL